MIASGTGVLLESSLYLYLYGHASADMPSMYMISVFIFYPYILLRGIITVMGYTYFERTYTKIRLSRDEKTKSDTILAFSSILLSLPKYSLIISAIILSMWTFFTNLKVIFFLFVLSLVFTILINSSFLVGQMRLKKAIFQTKGEISKPRRFYLIALISFIVRTLSGVVVVLLLVTIFWSNIEIVSNVICISPLSRVYGTITWISVIKYGIVLGISILLYISSSISTTLAVRKSLKLEIFENF